GASSRYAASSSVQYMSVRCGGDAGFPARRRRATGRLVGSRTIGRGGLRCNCHAQGGVGTNGASPGSGGGKKLWGGRRRDRPTRQEGEGPQSNEAVSSWAASRSAWYSCALTPGTNVATGL